MGLPTALRRWYSRFRIRRLKQRYRDRPYRDFYAAVMRERIRVGPEYAVGGMWEEIGGLQFEYLCREGLRPSHRLLDYGCGSLRGGLHFIRFLAPGHYTGLDISAEALEAGRRFVAESGLEERRPDLRLVEGQDLDALPSGGFDFVLAQSVLTHMPSADIRALFSRIARVMAPGARFYATFFEDPEGVRESRDRLNFYYPLEVMAEMAAEHGLDLRRRDDYAHPRGQVMLQIRPRPDAP